MTQLVILTALTASTGLFGGARTASSCPNGNCGAPAVAYHAPAAPVSYRSHYYAPAAPAPVSYRSHYSAPAAPAPAPVSYHSYYYAPSCPNGNCARR